MNWTPRINVQPGDQIVPAFTAAKTVAEAQQIRPGRGTRITTTPFGFIVEGNSGGSGFRHPFKPSLSGDRMTFTRGVVEGFEPVIGKVPISGTEKQSPPALKLTPDAIDTKTQQSWACVEVTPNAEGKLDATSFIQVVHRANPFSSDEKIGRHPLALILWNDGRPVRFFDQTFFNLRYARTTPAPGGGPPRHYFL